MIGKYFLFLILLGNITEFSLDASTKLFSRTGNLIYFLLGLISSIIMIVTLVYLFQISNLIYVNSMWEGIGILFETSLAFLILGEVLNNRYQYVGLGLIIVGLTLMNTGKIPY